MSSSALPRFYFDGHFHWNPSTNNNDDYSGEPVPLVPYDPASDTPNWAWLRQQTYKGNLVSNSNFRDWSYDALFNVGGTNSLPPAEWNFFGGMECGFVTAEQPRLEQPPNPDEPGTPVFSRPTGDGTTTVSGFTNSNAVYSTGDPTVGLELQFNTAPPKGPFPASPKLIDINPQSPFGSQIFADDFRLGDGTNGFSGTVSERMHSRWIYFNRNLNQDQGVMIAGVASTVFQTGLRNDEIEWHGDSPGLAELRSAADAAAGVMLRIVAYDTMYFNGPYFGTQRANQFPAMLKIRNLYIQYFADLERYNQGLSADPPPPPCNRAYSKIVGWLGVWHEGEFVTIPGGRMLLPSIMPNQPITEPVPVKLYSQAVTPESPPTPAGTGYPFGPATVERNADFTRITVDLCSTLPELDSTGQFAPYGPIDLGIVIDGEHHVLTTLVEDPTTFEPEYRKTAGLLDIATSSLAPVDGAALTSAQFDTNPLVLCANNYIYEANTSPADWASERAVALTENPLNAQTNSRGLYVEEPDVAVPGPTTVFTVDVRSYNTLPTEQVGLVVAQYDANFALLSGHSRQLVISYQAPSGKWIEFDSKTVIDASSGTVTVGLRGVSGPKATTTGAVPWLFFYPVGTDELAGSGLSPEHPVTDLAGLVVPNGHGGNPPIHPTEAFYAAVRLLPYDNAELVEFEQFLAGGPDADTVNNWVFERVYETFHLMYPVMDFIGTPQRFQAWRGRILEVTDPDGFASSAYMPPTRTLSAAKRNIIERYDDYISNVSALHQSPPAPSALPRG